MVRKQPLATSRKIVACSLKNLHVQLFFFCHLLLLNNIIISHLIIIYMMIFFVVHLASEIMCTVPHELTICAPALLRLPAEPPVSGVLHEEDLVQHCHWSRQSGRHHVPLSPGAAQVSPWLPQVYP